MDLISILGVVCFTLYINTPICLLILYQFAMSLRSPQRHREQNAAVPPQRRFFVTATATEFYESAIFNLRPQLKKSVVSTRREPHICYK
jgi:hypothetical protein